MNYLAHLYFADSTPDSCVGQLLPDCMPPAALPDRLSPELATHIVLHRKIDHFTDTHAAVRSLKSEFRPPFRRFAGILTDVLFDQCLALDWHRHHTESLEDFAQGVYRALDRYHGPENERLRTLRRALVTRQWLAGYASDTGIQHALQSLDRRSRFTTPLARAEDELARLQPEIHRTFAVFFPQLRDHVEQCRRSPDPL